ncbi:DeoR/GlpR family DNA-binding transcription regulator [Spongisporangium articulatum]|uniref:Lactose phosphotransferase system repressor n=1 Tax=Spongisporangium articulatum TaxID=3362603 RepID=A0ABW8AGR2_9ACTN
MTEKGDDRVVRPMFAEQRRQFMLRRLAATGRVEASQLAEELGVSGESIRKDLGELEDRGLLRRVHGGAIPVHELTVEPTVQQRGITREKEAIARAALAHLPAGGSLLIDAGSTTAEFAALLAASVPGDRELTVVTNALPIALTLGGLPGAEVHNVGGTVRRQTLAAVGQQALDALAEVNVETAFLGTNAISFSRGLTTPDPAEAAVKAAMLAAAQTRIVLADHTKFGRTARARHATLADIDLLITDSGVSTADLKALEAAGVAVEVARP